jgi:hypothetical protein
VEREQALVPFFPATEPDDRSSHAHRQLIGALGLVMPLLLWVIAAWRPLPLVPRWTPLDSVSAYYHTGAVVAFVGVVIALAVFLFTYRGYENASGRRDRVMAAIAGTAAVLVAFFPTRAPDAVAAPSWWTPFMGALHTAAAVALFSSFAYFALFLFPMARADQAPLRAEKRRRNRVYLLCGLGIGASIVWAGVAGLLQAPIFWPEVLALEFFAVSWLVKGRADRTAIALGRRALYYPAQLVRRRRSH